MAELGVRDERGEEQIIELGLGKEDDEEDKEDVDLKPWEQHSAVISIPRFDYKAPSSLMERPHSGFLITCPIKREKSATKEVIPILEEHMSFVCNERSEPYGKIVVKKMKKTCSQDAASLDRLEINKYANLSADSCETVEVANLPPISAENAKKIPNLSLVKLKRNGLLLFTMPSLNYEHAIDTLSSIFHSLGSGNQKSPMWCHRIFPIQEICCLTEKGLHPVVTNLAQWYFNTQHDKPQRPIKFAVGYNRRGIEETELKNKKCASEIALLQRNECFSVVAEAFKKVVENSTVDLKSPEAGPSPTHLASTAAVETDGVGAGVAESSAPAHASDYGAAGGVTKQVVILVELLPLSGLPPESLMAGVSVFPRELVITKPRLCIRPLLINTERNQRNLHS